MSPNKSTKRKNTGLAPGSAVYMGKKQDKDLYVEIFDYNIDNLKEEKVENIKSIFSYENKDNITWINVNGLNNVDAIKELGKYFELHPLLIEDIVNTHQRPKLDEYENYIFAVLKMLHFDSHNNLKIEHISFVLGEDYLLSFQESEGDVFDPIRERLRASKGLVRKMGADYLLYALIDIIVDNYFVLVDNLSEKTETLEDSLFNAPNNNQIAFEIQNFKREILKIRRAVYPLREVVSGINKVDTALVKEKTHLYLGDLHDHIIQVSENIDIYREMIWGLMDMHLTTLSNKMNEVMKVLTIIATIFIPLTFIAGIYGMNFENLPELKFKYAYFVLWAVMFFIFLGMLYYFKRKKWL